MIGIVSWYTLIGLLGQIFFAARMLWQWIASERQHRVVNPVIFWWLSMLGALSMSIYGFLRSDLAIMLAQFISYYIYIFNLHLKRQFLSWKVILIPILVFTPIILMAFELKSFDNFTKLFLNKEYIPYWLLAIGFIGQFLFTFRFIYQSIKSYRAKKSILPLKFWYISTIAALLVQLYGLLRLDIVLILGQVGGLITYIRNIKIYKQNERKNQ